MQIAGPPPRLRIFEWPVHLHGSFLCVEWFWERPAQSSGGRGVLSGRTPSVISLCEMPVPLFVAWRRHLPPAGGSLSTQVEALAKRAGLVLIRQRQEEASVKLQTFRLCQSLSLSGEVARRSRDGEGFSRDEPSQSPTATARSPFCRLPATSSPGRGKSFEGRALGKEGRSRPHSSTAGRSQPISGKLFAFAKASPFRERWHGEAVTERVAFRDELLPSFRFAKCQLPRGKLSSSSVNGQKEPAPIPSLDKPGLSCYDGIISNSRRLEQLACKTNGGKAR